MYIFGNLPNILTVLVSLHNTAHDSSENISTQKTLCVDGFYCLYDCKRKRCIVRNRNIFTLHFKINVVSKVIYDEFQTLSL